MKTKRLVIFASTLVLGVAAYGDTRTSANYNILTDALDYGGASESSANYQNTGSAGLINGIASTASGNAVVKSGYVAQLDSVALEVLSVVSRKVHGGQGPFDINLPLTGAAGIECRTGGVNGDHQLVVTFARPITVNGISVVSRDGQAGGVATVSGSVATVNLTAVANAQTLQVTLLEASNGSTTADIVIPMGVLVGDTNGSGVVNSGDALQTRSRSGQATDAANFASDVNIDGFVNSGDTLIVRSRSGTSLP